MEALELPTIQDIYALPEGVHAELIDGQIYYQACPSRLHQKIVHQLSYEIEHYIRGKQGECEVYVAPFAVFPYGDDSHYVEPDVSVICDKDKLDDRGCNGAPDWIIEILSPSNANHDSVRKLRLYKAVGVREYWIVDPENKMVVVYAFGDTDKITTYTFDELVVSGIFEDFRMDFGKIEE